MIRGVMAASSSQPPRIELPTTIGEEFGGGYYVGDLKLLDGPNAGVYAIIFAPPTPAVTLPYKTTATETPGADNESDGALNTAAMVADDITTHPAGEFCVTYSREGLADWYLPSRDELRLIWENRGLLPAFNMTSYIATSLQRNSTQYLRWFLIADYPPSNDPGSYNNADKTASARVIPCRRILKNR